MLAVFFSVESPETLDNARELSCVQGVGQGLVQNLFICLFITLWACFAAAAMGKQGKEQVHSLFGAP